MTTYYSPEFKASIIAKMLPPNNANVLDLIKETQIPKATLYCWRSKASRDAEGAAMAATTTGELGGRRSSPSWGRRSLSTRRS
jgi:transposase-like protein